MKDYYHILGVNRGASQEEIKSAYRRLARRYHPDVNSQDEDAESRFKEIGEAYEVLSDSEKRKDYDLFGERGRGRSPFEGGFDGFGGPLSDIFEMFFGRGNARPTREPSRGRDLLVSVEIGLEEAFRGVVKEIEITRNAPCGDCGGRGLEKGYHLDLCPDCGGDGRFTNMRRGVFGTFSSTTSCARCGGTGEINTHPCQSCGGRGAVRINDVVEVDIPAGIGDGDRLRIQGRGEAGSMGAPPGDLYVEVRVREHELFTRSGKDLHAVVSVGLAEAALGTDIVIPTLNGDERLRIPAGSQPGEVLRLRGKGMPGIRSREAGDLYLTLEVRVPRKLTAEQKKLLEDFNRLEAEKKEATGLIGRLRKAMRA